MKAGKAFIVGGGIAGLSCATTLAARGVKVELIEGAGHAGGRCRSYFDPELQMLIDNGNHLLLSGNRAAFAYLKRIGAEAFLAGPDKPVFEFLDLRNGERWRFDPGMSALPWWALSAPRRLAGTGLGDYARFVKLLWADPRKTIGEMIVHEGLAWEKLMRPFLLAALNTEPKDASARLAGNVLRESLMRGGRALLPRIASPSLAAAFIDPALEFLKQHGAAIRLGQRARAVIRGHRYVAALDLPDATIPLAPGDALVLAVPPWAARELVPELTAPDEFRAILNAHYKISAPFDGQSGVRMIGIVGGIAEWIFVFPDRISVTVSAADSIIDKDREELTRLLWNEVARALGLSNALPPWQIVKEKRATFAATPLQDARRPGARTRWSNLFLAGDWTQTGLPATIEGAAASGARAANLAHRYLKRNRPL